MGREMTSNGGVVPFQQVPRSAPLAARHPAFSIKLPDFLIIGAQKAGTTSLADHLNAHPNVAPATCKEVHFFDLHYAEGVNWYRSHFPVGRRRRLRSLLLREPLLVGDASPYYLFHPIAASRCFKLLPGARIIILLRDPVARAHSHYHHEVRGAWEPLSFEQAIEAESSRLANEPERLEADPLYRTFAHQHFSYLARGVYLHQINAWLRCYSSEQVLVLSSESFFEDPSAAYRRVLTFLGLPQWEPDKYRPQHVGKYNPIAPGTHESLIRYYAPYNQTLRHYLNSIWPGVGSAVVDRWPSPE